MYSLIVCVLSNSFLCRGSEYILLCCRAGDGRAELHQPGEKLRQSWHEVAMAANYFASALDFYMLIWVVDFL